MLWSLTYWLLKPVFLVLYRLQVAGRDNIPRAGPVIIAANHSSYLDPVVIGLAYRHRIRFMAKDELFRKPGVGWIMRLFRAFPVKRGARDLGAVKRALRILGQGGHVCVFPQGTRRRGELGDMEPGISLLASKSQAPVLPAAIVGTADVMPEGSRLPRFPRIRVIFGKPLEVDRAQASKQDLTTATDRLRGELERLLSEGSAS